LTQSSAAGLAVFATAARVAVSRVRDDERESLKRKIGMAEEMLANLRADVPARDTVIAAMEMVIADAENELAEAGDNETCGEPSSRFQRG
jgi:hypothetical protein